MHVYKKFYAELEGYIFLLLNSNLLQAKNISLAFSVLFLLTKAIQHHFRYLKKLKSYLKLNDN